MTTPGRHRPDMMIRTTLAAIAVLACAACGSTGPGPANSTFPSTSATTSASNDSALPSATSGTAVPHMSIPTGPGPQAKYTVTAQPAPGTCHYRHTNSGQPLPDPNCTPGALNPAVTQANLAATICKSGYTKSIRPPAAITDEEKRANALSYGYTGTLGQAEYDHLISLELGGDPNSANNIWVEPPSPGHVASQGVSNPKDPVESAVNKLVCDAVHLASRDAGSAVSYLPLAIAQQLIAADWTTALSTGMHDLVPG